jgi:GDP-L-fucose synthase
VFMDSDSRVLVAGANGMVGSAIVRNLKKQGYFNIIEATRNRVDFSDQEDTKEFFQRNKPEYVFVAAAKVGGIMANKTYKGDFLYQNLMIQNNIIHYSMVNDLKKLLFLGSSCIYPKLATQPITEDQLMTGALEPTNDAYAIAKIAGIKLCQSYREQYGFNAISLMPTNLYGPNDNFDLQNSHVLPALIRKFHEAKESNAPYVECWGDGSPMREFLHVDDLAEACFRCMISYNDSQIINVGTGEDLTIKELTELISIIIGYNGEIRWDDSKPNGTLRKVLNVDKIKSLGWSPKIGIRQGIYETYEWYKKNAIFL